MRKEHQKILLDATKLIGSIPAVNFVGATATVQAYVSAYKDYNEACRLVGIISVNIDQVQKTEKAIRTYRNKDGYDIESLEEALAFYESLISKAYEELKAFIFEREAQHWE